MNEWWYIVGMLGPFGAVGLIRAVMNSYNESRRPPELMLGFTPADEVTKYEPILEELIPIVFEMSRWDCILTDGSSLGDFAPEYPVIRSLELIRERYGVVVGELTDDRLVTICSAIARRA